MKNKARFVARENNNPNGFIDDAGLASMFQVLFMKEFWVEPSGNCQIYRKVSDEFNEMSFKVNVYRGVSCYEESRDIKRMDEPRIIADVLRIAQRHRLIGQKVYELVDDLKLDGEYILSAQGTPLVKVSGTPREETGWIANPVRFVSYDGKNSFSHIPHLPEREFDLELSISSRENRRIIEEMYRRTFERYKEEGFVLANSVKSA